MTALEACYEILKKEGRPLHISELTKRVLESGLWKTSGKTPDKTITAAINTEINTNGDKTRFTRVESATFYIKVNKVDFPITNGSDDLPKIRQYGIEYLKREVDEVNAAFELLKDSYDSIIHKIQTCYIPQFSQEGNINEVIYLGNLAKNIKKHTDTLQEEYTYWRKLVGFQTIEEDEIESNSSNEKSVLDRTTWRVENGNIKIETTRQDNSGTYQNTIPNSIFIDVVRSIVEQSSRYKKDSIRTSNITALLSDRIIQETSYKKSPNTVVYNVIKIMLKENLIKAKEESKRLYELCVNPRIIERWIKEKI